jgi:hypothetical protein
MMSFSDGQVFTLTASPDEGVSEWQFDRSFVALTDILVFDTQMRPAGVVTSGRDVTAVPEPPSSLTVDWACRWAFSAETDLFRDVAVTQQ